ncbi:hypothetical protein [Granulibacter bethesdensis]|nr:hypothetical protein [Granulibacter bethesdensis]
MARRRRSGLQQEIPVSHLRPGDRVRISSRMHEVIMVSVEAGGADSSVMVTLTIRPDGVRHAPEEKITRAADAVVFYRRRVP